MKPIDLPTLIESLSDHIPRPEEGLPMEAFHFVSTLTPLINVDLLIRNEKNQTLLVWRNCGLYHGWHVAGGIIRFRDKMADRIQKVAKTELGTTVEFDCVPLAMHEKFAEKRNIRGHFISLLYRCRLLGPLDENLRCHDPKTPIPGEWYWHDQCPENIIEEHKVYREFIDEGSSELWFRSETIRERTQPADYQ